MIKKAAVALNIPYIRLSKWSTLIGTFLLGQGALQVIQLFTGFLLFRWLSVEQYAQYSMAFAFQITAHVLVEFGFSGTIVALVGNRINDKQVIGGYIKAGQYYRNKLCLFISIACIIVFPLLTIKHGWPVITTILLLVSIVTNLFFTGWASYYTPPLRIHQKIGQLYQIQVKSSLLRLVVLNLLYVVSALNSWLAALIGSLQTFITGYLTKRAAQVHIEEPAEADPEARQEMVQFIKPLMPVIIFNAFQGQIMVFLLSLFGKTNNIAEIGALSRIGQLYTVFIMGSGVLIAPYIARQPIQKLLKQYIGIIIGTIAFSAVIVLFGYVFPEPLLWVLGSKYDHLTQELGLLLIGSGINLTNVITWEMNESRKWIFGWDPISIITGTLILEIICMLVLNLGTLHDVLILNIVTNAFVLLIRLAVGYYGFTRFNNNQ